MSINLEEIVERAVPTSQGLYRVVRTEDFDALVAEVERLRAERHLDNADLAQAYDFARDKATAKERAAVVAYVRSEANKPHPIEAGERALSPSGRGLLLFYADRIERGEHRREEGL